MGLRHSWIKLSRLLLLVFVRYIYCSHNCHSGVLVDEVCYFTNVGYPNLTWTEAEDACVLNYGHLASIKNDQVHRALEVLMRDNAMSGAWIGATEEFNLWFWLDGSGVLQPQGCYADDPLNRDLKYEENITGLTAELCIDSCKKANFEYAGTQYGHRCFCGDNFGKYGTQKVCTVECSGNTNNSMSKWCGGENMNFIYRTNGAYANFGYHQPNNHGGYQLCGIIDMLIETKMADEPCARPLPFICDSNLAQCSGPGYVLLGNTWCIFIGTTEISWFQAKENCQTTHAGDVISLSSREKHDAVKELLSRRFPDKDPPKFWIGMTKSNWRWTARNTPFKFTAWIPGAPNGLNEKCGVMKTLPAVMTNRDPPQSWQYGWEDENCTTLRPYICQGVDPSSLTTSRPVDQASSSTLPSTNGSTQSHGPSPIITPSPGYPPSSPPTRASPSPPSLPNSTRSFSTLPSSNHSLSSTPSAFPSSSTSPIGVSLSTTRPQSTTPSVVTAKPQPNATSLSTSSGGTSKPLIPSEPLTHGPSTPSTIQSVKSTISISVTPAPSSTPSSSSGPNYTDGNGLTTTGEANTGNTPRAGASIVNGQSFLSTAELLLIVLLGILFLVVLVVFIVLCCVFCKNRRNRVYAKGYDARPIAPVPNSGDEPNYDEFASTLSLNKYGPY